MTKTVEELRKRRREQAAEYILEKIMRRHRWDTNTRDRLTAYMTRLITEEIRLNSHRL